MTAAPPCAPPKAVGNSEGAGTVEYIVDGSETALRVDTGSGSWR